MAEPVEIKLDVKIPQDAEVVCTEEVKIKSNVSSFVNTITLKIIIIIEANKSFDEVKGGCMTEVQLRPCLSGGSVV